MKLLGISYIFNIDLELLIDFGFEFLQLMDHSTEENLIIGRIWKNVKFKVGVF